MGLSAYYTDAIKGYDSSIQEKQEENKQLEQQEEEQRELLNQQSWNTFRLKQQLRAQKNKIYSFLKEAGGLFNLNGEQQALYSQMLTEKGNIFRNYDSSRDLQYSYSMNATVLHNRQLSNCLTIFNDTLDKGQLLNQQVLYEKYTEDLA